jgi:uncharacterized UPF0160 family protein
MTTNLKVAHAYFKLLNSIDWKDDVLLFGLREGLNKFLSNAFLKLNMGRKHHQADFYSQKAIQKIITGDYTNLIYEHMVPKTEYIQQRCEEKARGGKLTIDFVVDRLERYWRIAVITKDEDNLLERSRMPVDWDGIDILARYVSAGIALEAASELVSKYENWPGLKGHCRSRESIMMKHERSRQ